MQAPIIDCNIQKINIQGANINEVLFRNQTSIDKLRQSLTPIESRVSRAGDFVSSNFDDVVGFADLMPWTLRIANYLYSRNCGITTFSACKHEAFTENEGKSLFKLNEHESNFRCSAFKEIN